LSLSACGPPAHVLKLFLSCGSQSGAIDAKRAEGEGGEDQPE